MLRATTNNALGNRPSLETTLALWTPRNPNGNGISKKQPGHSNSLNEKSQPPFATARFHQRRHFTVRAGGLGAARITGDQSQVEVLTKLPSLYARSPAGNPGGGGYSSQRASQQQQAWATVTPTPQHLLPLLHGNKRDRLQQQLLLQHQPLPPTQEAQLIDDVEATYEAVEEKLHDRSRFRITLTAKLLLEEKQEEHQEQQQQPSRRTVPIAYFSRVSGSLRSLRVEDLDARSCDLRHPNHTVAYARAADYIRDNELMSPAKSQHIWRWIDALENQGAAGLFIYDQTAKWFVATSDERDGS